jgi:hypothetical protein
LHLIKTRAKLEFIKALQAEGNDDGEVTDLMMRAHWRKAIGTSQKM